MKKIRVIGAGISGSEVCYQLLKRNYFVELFEVKSIKKNAIQTNDLFANLAYSDSFHSNEITSAKGVLKQEMRLLDSFIIKVADYASVATEPLLVDRNKFQEYITNYLKSHKNLKIIEKEIKKLVGESNFNYFDQVQPIILKRTVNWDYLQKSSNDDKLFYCFLNKAEFEHLYSLIINAEIFISPLPNEIALVHNHGFSSIETIAYKGKKELKNLLSTDELIESNDFYAVISLKQDEYNENLLRIVNFQTNIKIPWQNEIIKSIPALKNSSILRYGVMHKNDYINSANVLDDDFSLKSKPNIFFVGQLTGTDGYLEASASAIICAINVDRYLRNLPKAIPNNKTVIGSLCNYVLKANKADFQPMEANWGLVEDIHLVPYNNEGKKKLSDRALFEIKEFIKQNL
ncbi:methylenetetrahydrofolate--tRNA-(uracil-5-)-methyltransferase [Mycoplasmopsis bovis]|uniref:tRNA (Uracil-5-)-methyltransferase Gid n=1 Tax=Mycoplasmopsis bovis TaxID=28903 RepID=A0A8D4A4V8_MYCBV|nr:FAD-dependent oxidoreductase [Mycoplasmopsis bovis]AMW24848.1 tRNA (uracil-5-)-methyltransferase Gid [Mycoplasmopsis bovis]AMW25479.1 tRNA (uracil-5-)-methyltransferase Gid [Mycoplasmopsis bovis]AMW26110.1 tRNA (uracil-5-)-methyltransferase Gid [Mycoplasmopsis bovis]TQF45218.1 methylenetetrahydrofolate--tRNA-(uracil-5-)-methyltransferase [Mycoplasmopsis bovis]TQF59952.1 methylenetetrahydrofolate--tRNA-(uracil-5-)-methyltransferase [Mycoplasmopsis bovis]